MAAQFCGILRVFQHDHQRVHEFVIDDAALSGELGCEHRLIRLRDLSFAVRDLKSFFPPSRAADPKSLASALIRRHKRMLVESVSSWSGSRPGEVDRVVASLAKLCDSNRLVVRGDRSAALIRFSAYVSTLIHNRLRTHRYGLRKG